MIVFGFIMISFLFHYSKGYSFGLFLIYLPYFSFLQTRHQLESCIAHFFIYIHYKSCFLDIIYCVNYIYGCKNFTSPYKLYYITHSMFSLSLFLHYIIICHLFLKFNHSFSFCLPIFRQFMLT